MIRGKKNFLPPTQLVLGFGFLFRLSEESIPRHANERSRRTQTSSIGDGSIRSSISEGDGLAEAQHELSPIDSDDSGDTDPEKSDYDEDAFPDTRVEVGLPPGVLRGRTVSCVSASSAGVSDDVGGSSSGLAEEEGEGTVITAGILPGARTMDSAKLAKNAKKKEKEAKKKGKGVDKETTVPVEPAQSTSSSSTGNKPKRGQHGRQKKLKEKYRFQDDEERELRMQLLQVSRHFINGSWC